jgi:hypothetical protein
VDIIDFSVVENLPRYDSGDSVKPNYVSATYPLNKGTAGTIEFDHGEGLAPATALIDISGMANGSELAVYKTSDMSVIVSPQSTTGTYTGSYTYTADIPITVRVRKGTAASKYLPYEYAGIIKSTGFSLNVSQVLDPIA